MGGVNSNFRLLSVTLISLRNGTNRIGYRLSLFCIPGVLAVGNSQQLLYIK